MAAVDKMTFTVLDARGGVAAEGETDGPALELPAGEYSLVVHAAGETLRADHVVVAARGDSVVKVVIEGGRFQLLR